MAKEPKRKATKGSRHAVSGNAQAKFPTRTSVVIFPFDLFGSAGTSAGAKSIHDALLEVIDDNLREETPTRAQAYRDFVRLEPCDFETIQDYQDWRQRGRALARRLRDKGERLLWMAGNHLGVLPVYEELGSETLVIQFDAHLDIHQFSDCTRELSHGNFLRHLEGDRPSVINIGHRELLLLEEDIRAFYAATYSAEALAIDPDSCIAKLKQACQNAQHIFLDVDCDVLDPAYFPAVAQSVPFGITARLLLRIVDAVWSDRIIGAAISEFEPASDQNDRSLATLMWFIERLLLKWYESTETSR